MFPEKEEPSVNFTYQALSNFEELKGKVKEYYQKHQAEIKQNPEFTDWIEVSKRQFVAPFKESDNFYIYLGTKRKTLNFGQGDLMALKIYSIEKENNENLKKELEK